MSSKESELSYLVRVRLRVRLRVRGHGLGVKESELSYRPLTGLAAATTAHRAWREVMMPALEMEMDCCSIA